MSSEQDNKNVTNDSSETSVATMPDQSNNADNRKAGQLQGQRSNTSRERQSRNKGDFRKPKEHSDFSEKVIWIRRINKVTTGGRRLRFAATVAVGDEKGTVGIFNAKAYEVSEAIKKASAGAHKNLKKIALNKDASIFHTGVGTYCASKILLKPAKEGIGVKAGGAARDIIELAGIKNIYSKSLGSNNKINLARATIAGLTSLKSEKHFQARSLRRRDYENLNKEAKK